MIAFLTGRVAEKGAAHALVDVGGVGYRLAMSTASLSALPAEGDAVTVHTYLHVREDELSLFGFESRAEQELFERLITVSGVGPKVALAALSGFTPDTLTAAIVAEDAGLISSIPGIGAKTAQRIILDLKDKLAGSVEPGAVTGVVAGSDAAEARDALLAMGFTSAEVATALKGFDGDPADTQARLTHALRRLGGGV